MRLREEVQQAGVAGEVGQHPHLHLRVVRRHQHPPCMGAPANQMLPRLQAVQAPCVGGLFGALMAQLQKATLYIACASYVAYVT